MRRAVVYLFILCLASLLSCKGNDYKVNIENINLNLEFNENFKLLINNFTKLFKNSNSLVFWYII